MRLLHWLIGGHRSMTISDWEHRQFETPPVETRSYCTSKELLEQHIARVAAIPRDEVAIAEREERAEAMRRRQWWLTR